MTNVKKGFRGHCSLGKPEYTMKLENIKVYNDLTEIVIKQKELLYLYNHNLIIIPKKDYEH
jgi:hypothetical protein